MDELVEVKRQREITVNLREAASDRVSHWVLFERITRVLSAVAIPVVLAITGFAVNARLQDQTAKREYVTLAVSILQEADPKKVPPEMKQWAARLLDENAPTKLPPELLSRLQAGGAVLPGNAPLVMVSGWIVASPGETPLGGAARLSWATTNATTDLITPKIGLVEPSGSIDVSPTETTTYTMTLTNQTGGWGTASATVRVTGVVGGKAPRK